MDCLLTYYDQVELEAISVQAAVLEEVTYVKVLMTGVNQTYGAAKGATKTLIDWLGIPISIDYQYSESTAELVTKRAEYYSRKNKYFTKQFIFNTLGERLGVPSSDTALMSTRIIEEAAAGYDISAGLLLSQQAEAVADKYILDCIEGVKDQLRKQSAAEIKITEKIMSEQIRNMTPAEKLEIQRALNLQTLSASSLRDTFLKSGLPLASIAALQVGGFGSYLALTTIMHAVFTSMLGITLPFAAYTSATSALSFLTGPIGIMLSLSVGFLSYFWGQKKIERSQYAMIVWTCVMHAQKPLVPPTHLLPSAQKHRLLTDGAELPPNIPDNERQDYEALKRERSQKEVASRNLEIAQRSLDESDKRIRTLEQRLQRTEELLATSSSRQNTGSQLNNSLESQIRGQQESIVGLKKELELASRATNEFNVQLAKEKKNAADSEARFVNRLERRTKQLKALWGVHYPKIDFHQQPLYWSAEQDFAGWLEIERALKELADAPDPVKLSRSRMHTTHEHHSRFTIPNGVECRMFYTVKNGRIELHRICKKKDC